MDGDVIEAVVSVLPTIGLLAVMLVGLVLWLIGRRIARAACAVSGLVLGGLAGFVLGEMLTDRGGITIALVVGAGIAGALLAGLLFRVWMALSGAALLALMAPAAVLVWQGAPAIDEPADAPAATAEADDGDDGERNGVVDDLLRRSIDAMNGEDGDAADGGVEGDADAEAGDFGQVVEAASQAARQWYDEQLEGVRAWWADLSPATRGTIGVAALFGAAAGLLLGLLLPWVAASLESALVGAILLVLAGRQLVVMHAPDAAGWFPQSPRALLLWLGLITVLGFAIQWTLSARRTDK